MRAAHPGSRERGARSGEPNPERARTARCIEETARCRCDREARGGGFRRAEKEDGCRGGEDHSAEIKERRRPAELSDPGGGSADAAARNGGECGHAANSRQLHGFRGGQSKVGSAARGIARNSVQGFGFLERVDTEEQYPPDRARSGKAQRGSGVRVVAAKYFFKQ